jgi:hypothetical protein
VARERVDAVRAARELLRHLDRADDARRLVPLLGVTHVKAKRTLIDVTVALGAAGACSGETGKVTSPVVDAATPVALSPMHEMWRTPALVGFAVRRNGL